MKDVKRTCNELVDCLHSACTEDDFKRIAERTAHALGFRWFAYFGQRANGPSLISSYPKSWTSHYFREGYDNIDPVLQEPRTTSRMVLWDGRSARSAKSAKQRRLFDDALSFKIRTGLTVRIPSSQNQFAAFTLAVDERSLGFDRFIESSQDMLEMVGLTFHAHVSAKIGRALIGDGSINPLTQRERQCLGWISDGKTMQDIAELLDVSPRGVKFHLDNARRNLAALTLPHAVALAFRQGLLP
ncbi:helix-turn-helix transcriptional regulator [Bradyrhizobium elkanii]|jgi:LuxR family transcriptional regulator, activator of conjugal transfer of Ti plasmids|uniref:DNA-binding CsgD family transcriptional regulator n=1 Tax=Bradyrhizobium elkanii TaxID=29448 RepID=A0A8I2CAR0_BRAEL|nr:LuxR family transcriptional regulator [Bradyrhizobium elkanii]MBP1299932.1 DNA-binding CsgD family transcriptional regulator [Bradyrhizobium elkanii]MCP1975409.1 DNA-binding CsgD family transcriptional regulator [Bradyrhizobium elkanii]MCS3482479.1 DNA-binding CsgD family transcriptional regulator [Bradyrhizobium elkanii]MCS3525142.1 DNA-binding CsgD family transcriptional regulator [Bradyrhizobium elkanii]MCS4075955.1 DNA-binding CsgD family transcriptional regulator [Bradyrhizobium elkani